MIELTPDEVHAIRQSIPEMERRLASLKDDAANELPVGHLIEPLERALIGARHMLKKYGPAASRRR